MPKADLVLTNAHVVTMDDRFQVFREGGLAILDGELVAVGPSHQVVSSYPDAEVVDCGGKALIPGLINAHTHAAMSLL
ncbi:MAG: amidohydrolase family protein, partial [Anaerolineales bacterium]